MHNTDTPRHWVMTVLAIALVMLLAVLLSACGSNQ